MVNRVIIVVASAQARFFLFLLLVTGPANSLRADVQGPPVRDGVLDLNRSPSFLKTGMVDLFGRWEFHWKKFRGELPSTNEPGIMLVSAPRDWRDYRIEGKRLPVYGHATYRIKVHAPRTDGEFALRIPHIASAYRVLVDGREVLSLGKISKDAGDFQPGLGPILSRPFPLGQASEIVLEAANFAFPEGGMVRSIRLGRHEILKAQSERNIAFTYFLAGSLFFMALYHFMLFGLDRREKSALFFAFMCLGITGRFICIEERVIDQLISDLSYNANIRINLLSSLFTFAASGFFLGYLYPSRRNLLLPSLLALSAVPAGLLVAFTPPAIHYRIVPYFTTIVAVLGIYAAVIMGTGVREGLPGSRPLFIACMCFFATAINDALYALHFIYGTIYISKYGFAVFVLAQAFTISQRILHSRRLSESLAGELEESNRQLRSLDKLKDDFLASTSHELRTPLQGIIGMADSLRERKARSDSSLVERRLDLIIASGRRLSGLVNDILDFSKLRNNAVKLRLTAIDPRALADLQLELIGYGMQNRDGPVLRNEVPEDFPFVHGDEARLTQILHNLLDNAVKFTRAGEIAIGARLLPHDRAEISVRDTGASIHPDDHERIFNAFEIIGVNAPAP